MIPPTYKTTKLNSPQSDQKMKGKIKERIHFAIAGSEQAEGVPNERGESAPSLFKVIGAMHRQAAPRGRGSTALQGGNERDAIRTALDRDASIHNRVCQARTAPSVCPNISP